MKIDSFVAQTVDVAGKHLINLQGQVFKAADGSTATVLDLLDMQRRAQQGMEGLRRVLVDVQAMLQPFDVYLGKEDND